MSDTADFLGRGFVTSWRDHPKKTALVVEDETLSYAELGTRSASICRTLNSERTPDSNHVGLLVGKSSDAYAGILGTLLSGRAYVPIKPEHPASRNRQILTDCTTDVLLIDRSGFETLPALLKELDRSVSVVCLFELDEDQQAELRDVDSTTRVISVDTQPTATNEIGPKISPDISIMETAYVLFTSGSTGRPKGVPITHQNARSYIEYIRDCYDFMPSDRFSQFFDLTFDLSVHDMFVCWGEGASLHVIPESKRMAPGPFITDENLTVWFTVPSTAMFMSEFNQLKPDSYENLRYSLFCGEALSGRISEKWQMAAPNSFVENLYGPTESTIATARYRWEKDESKDKCENGITPIGKVFSTQQWRIINRDNEEVTQGEEGELCVSGPQVFGGYLNKPAETNEAFIKINDTEWYRTGDLVWEDDDGILHFRSRIDDQIQVRGHRVELLETESVLRQITGTEMAAAVGWPMKDGVAQSIHAFLAAEDSVDTESILSLCESELPGYMCPKEIHLIDEMPLNVNGKIDRQQLTTRLHEAHE